jgi:hypothetical protein
MLGRFAKGFDSTAMRATLAASYFVGHRLTSTSHRHEAADGVYFTRSLDNSSSEIFHKLLH